MYSIKFTDQQLAVLNDALVQMPYYVAAPVIAHINEEIMRHRQSDDSGTLTNERQSPAPPEKP